MDVCPECDETIAANRALDPGEACPACGRIAQSADAIDLVNVARVANLAEAGFICDELIGLGMEARIHQFEDFDAASHRSYTQYLIRVPGELAQDAAGHVRQYLNEDAQDRPTLLDTFRFYGSGSGEPISWRPIAFVVLAGVASFALGQRFSDAPADRRPPQNALLTAIGEIDRPLISEPTANQPRYRLSFDRRQQAWTLQTDRDNDGQFETSEHFRATGAAR